MDTLLNSKNLDIRNVRENVISNDIFFNKMIEYKKDNLIDYDKFIENIVPHKNFIVRNIIKEISDELLTFKNIYSMLECYEIYKDDMDINDYMVINNEMRESIDDYITFYDENVKSVKKTIESIMRKKENKVNRKCSLDYLKDNIKNDDNIENRITFFIKYLKYKISLNHVNLKISEFINEINKDETNVLLTKMLELKNIFDSKINFNKISTYINNEDDEEVNIEELSKKMVGEYEKSIIKALEDIEKIFEKDKIRQVKQNMSDISKITNNLMLVSDVLVEDVVTSPYEGIRDDILKNNEKFERSNDILKFIHKYCRRASKNEIKEDNNYKYWFICNETNIKLVPSFYYDIAVSVIERPYDTDYHNSVIEKISSRQGTIELGKTICIHTGYVIKEGALINSYDMETNNEELVYEDEDGHFNYGEVNVINEIDNEYGIEDEDEDNMDRENEDEEDYYDFFIDDKMNDELKLKDFNDFNAEIYSKEIIKKVSNLVLDLNLSQEKINTLVSKSLYVFNIDNNEKIFKLNNSKDSMMILQYKTFIVLYSVSLLYIHIQMDNDIKKIYENEDNNINIDVFKSGFPVYSDDNYKGIEVYSNILKNNYKKVRDNGFETCLQLKREKEEEIDYFTKNMIKCIRKNILKNKRLKLEIDKYKNKIEQDEYENENIFKKNKHILPMLQKGSLNILKENYEPVSDEFKSKIKNGNNILNRLLIVNSKDIFYSYLIIDKINTLVSNKSLGLNNYVQNMCCNNKEGHDIIEYLEDIKIREYKKLSKENEELLNYVKKIKEKDLNYNNNELKGNCLSKEHSEYSKDVLDDIDKIIDPTNDQLLEKDSLLEKLQIYYENKKYEIDLDYEYYDKSYEEVYGDDVDNNINELFFNMKKNKKDDDDVFEKKIYNVNSLLRNKCMKYFDLDNNEKQFLDPNFQDNEILKMKSHILKYCYVSLNEKINSKNIFNQNNTMVKDSLILKCWNLSDNLKNELNNILINELSYKNYQDDSYNEELKGILKKSIDYYKQYKSVIEYVDISDGVEKNKVLLYLKYMYLKMLSLLIDDEISGENNKKIKKLIKGYSKNYLSTLKIVNIDVKRLNKEVVIQIEDEKDKVTENLRKMTQDKRDVEMELRKNKLGKWGISKQKGFFKYSKKFEDNIF